MNRPASTDSLVGLVADFLESRRVIAGRLTVVDSLGEALRIVSLKGPDRRWKTINARGSSADAPLTSIPISGAAVEREILQRALVAEFRNSTGGRLTTPWYLRQTVVSSSHFARCSLAIRDARAIGLGWLLPANGEVLIVPMPVVRLVEGSPEILHDDTGKLAVRWPDGTGDHYLHGTWFSASIYRRVIAQEMSLAEVAALFNADQRSVALTYLTFRRLVGQSGAVLIDRGIRGTRLYRLRLPASIARDRPAGYGEFDYFIHMNDASHPEREFIEWVDPRIGHRGDAELCQAHAFGISLEQWMAIADEG